MPTSLYAFAVTLTNGWMVCKKIHLCLWQQSLKFLVCLRLQDLSNYNKNAVIIAKKYFTVSDIDDYYKKADAKPLIFCHFARGLGEKVYNEVTEFRDLYKTLMEVYQHTTHLL